MLVGNENLDLIWTIDIKKIWDNFRFRHELGNIHNTIFIELKNDSEIQR